MTRNLKLPDLPICKLLPALATALAQAQAVVLEAPPGAGKSTVIPLALLDAAWRADRKIIMLEPRRLAARAVAQRLAATLGERVGQTVGYRMRLDTQVSAATRIEVVTDGILMRLLESDPALEDTAIVIFDEFHERSLSADTGLALCRDAQQTLRPDLRLLVMSATLDGEAVSKLLNDAPRLTSTGRSFPVDVRYADRTPDHLERAVAHTIRRALTEETGDALVFLPGAAEIRRLTEQLVRSDWPDHIDLLPLYGELSGEQQDRALTPSAPGRRKVVLATSIAETSLTIEGIRIVVDAGLARRSQFDPGSGMSRLETTAVSKAAAEQRRGRAGRTQTGVCYRIYTEAQYRRYPSHTPPEICEADLSGLALDLAAWGTEADALLWLDPPPPAHLAQARDLLTRLGALAVDRITPVGQAMTQLGAHPRLARMLLAADGPESIRMACDLAALLTERDFVRTPPQQRDSSLEKRLELLAGRSVAGLEVDRVAINRIRRLSDLWKNQLRHRPRSGTTDARRAPTEAGQLLAYAYPDRIARRRGDSNRYLMSNGRGALFAGPDGLTQHGFIVIADLDGAEREARIYRAAAISRSWLLETLSDHISVSERIEWNAREHVVSALKEWQLGALPLMEESLNAPPTEAASTAMLTGIRTLGLNALPWTPASRSLQTRVLFLRSVLPPNDSAAWPDLSDDTLMATLETWLQPFLDGITRRDHLARLDLTMILGQCLTYALTQTLTQLAPTHLLVPSGSTVPIDYAQDPPRVSVRLQEVFGLLKTPTVANQRVALAIELLSPARRPVQITRDLESFWSKGYEEVRRELKGRYPKHFWPDDPRHAQATARAKPRV